MRRVAAVALTVASLHAGSCVVPIEDVEDATGGTTGSGGAKPDGSSGGSGNTPSGGSSNGGSGGTPGGTSDGGGIGGVGPPSGGGSPNDGGNGGLAGAGLAGNGGGGMTGGSGGDVTDAGLPIGGGGGAAGDSGVGPCGPSCSSCIEVGRFATWCGKVNMHTTPFGWQADPDCSSGCNTSEPLAYCKKFYPNAVTVTKATPSVNKVFQNAGCVGQYVFPGEIEYVCWGCATTG